VAKRIYICYSADNLSPQEAQVFHQLRNRLQQEGHEVLANADLSAEQGPSSFLEDQLPMCQGLILIQTPGAIRSPLAPLVIKTAQRLANQQRLQNILRFIASSDEQQTTPAEWSALPTIDGTYDPSRAIEKVTLMVAEERTLVESNTAPPPPAIRTPYITSRSYDRPMVPPSRWQQLKNTYQDMGPGRKSLLFIVIALLLLTAPGVMLGNYLLTRPVPVAPMPPPPLYGYVYFTSSGFLGPDNTSGIADGLDIQLQGLKQPAAEHSYYAWLLPDKSELRGPTLMVGSFTPKDGKVHLSYQNPKHTNLLASDSRFMITEEPASPAPEGPNADKSTWRYYGELPQIPNPNDTDHFSDLDHLRHLLAGVQSVDMGMMKGGLGIWFLQNIRKIFEWASAARGTNMPQNPDLMHRHFVRILDYLDGAEMVKMDVPKGTPLLVDEKIASTPLLSLDENAMQGGYVRQIELHLLGLSNSPSSTKEQQKLAGLLDVELNKIKTTLDQIREDAKKLVNMNNDQLMSESTLPLLDNLVTESNIALTGRVDPATGIRQGGATWIFDQMQRLALFTVRLPQEGTEPGNTPAMPGNTPVMPGKTPSM
jgi:hypothetical protein